MVNMKDRYNCIVTLHETGNDIKVWENPTRDEMHTILTHLEYLNKSGKDIEDFKIQKNVKLIGG